MLKKPPPPDFAAMSDSELRALVVTLLAKVAELERVVTEQRDEIARLKGLKGRPKLKPSGMDKSTEPKSSGKGRGGGGAGGSGGKTAKLKTHKQRIIKADPPPGSRFKGYEDFVMQDLVLQPHVTRFRRERWVTPDGKTVVAPLPSEVTGHFGLELIRFVLSQYHQGQVTIPRILVQLHEQGIHFEKVLSI